MTTCRMRLTSSGRRYFIDDVEVDKAAYKHACTQEYHEVMGGREMQHGRRFSQPALLRGVDYGWQNENGGLGRRIHQLEEYPGDPNACVRSRAEIPEKAKRKGFLRIDKA